jgi:hypothetical protein
MDEIVLRGMARWPGVPKVYGWLALDRRGEWRLKNPASGAFERVGNRALREFIGRNYAAGTRLLVFPERPAARVRAACLHAARAPPGGRAAA